MVQRTDFDKFGVTTFDTAGAVQVPFGFAGGLADRSIDLIRFGARDYAPSSGRWTAKDPILFSGHDTDLYSYAYQNPLQSIDPSGLAPFTNNSQVGIPYKPESEDYQPPRIAQPGETVDADGIYSPPGAKNPKCIKIPDNCSAAAHSGGTVQLDCGLLGAADELYGIPDLPMLPPLEGRFTPRQLGPEDFQSDNFENWPDPYTGRNWPYEQWTRP